MIELLVNRLIMAHRPLVETLLMGRISVASADILINE